MKVQQTIVNLQGLRLLAAFMVMFGHVQDEAHRLMGQYDRWMPVPWAAGVDIFFAISGFVMVMTTRDIDAGPRDALHFLKRRVIRIGPMYWIFTTLAIALTVTLRSSLTWKEGLFSYLFFPYSDREFLVRPVPALNVGWTINNEMMFYLLFALSLCLPRKVSVWILSAAVVAMAALHPLVPKEWDPLYAWTSPIILEFVGGMMLGVAHKNGLRLDVVTATGVTLAAIAGNALAWSEWGGAHRVLGWGIPGLLIVTAAATTHDVSAQSKIGKLLRTGGDASFAIYLSHIFTLNALGLAWKRFHLGAPVFYVVVALLTGMGIGLATHLLVEKRVSVWLRSNRKPRALDASRQQADLIADVT